MQLGRFPFTEPAAELVESLVNLVISVNEVGGCDLEYSIDLHEYFLVHEFIEDIEPSHPFHPQLLHWPVILVKPKVQS